MNTAIPTTLKTTLTAGLESTFKDPLAKKVLGSCTSSSGFLTPTAVVTLTVAAQNPLAHIVQHFHEKTDAVLHSSSCLPDQVYEHWLHRPEEFLASLAQLGAELNMAKTVVNSAAYMNGEIESNDSVQND